MGNGLKGECESGMGFFNVWSACGFWLVGAEVTKRYFKISGHQYSSAISFGVYVTVQWESAVSCLVCVWAGCGGILVPVKTTQGIHLYVIRFHRGTSAPITLVYVWTSFPKERLANEGLPHLTGTFWK